MVTVGIQGTRRIKGILFDVDGTLYHQAPCRAIMLVLLFLFHFSRPSELWKKLRVILQYRESQEILRKLPMAGIGNQKSQILLTARHTNESVSYISDVVEDWFEKKPLPFLRFCRRRELRESLSLLFQRGIKLGIFSDYPAENKLKALGISNLITTVVPSGNMEIYGFKPRTNGFKIAADKMGLDPAEILYVGDRPEIDGLGGSEAGMQVAILKRFGKRNGCQYPLVRSFPELLRTIG